MCVRNAFCRKTLRFTTPRNFDPALGRLIAAHTQAHTTHTHTVRRRSFLSLREHCDRFALFARGIGIARAIGLAMPRSIDIAGKTGDATFNP